MSGDAGTPEEYLASLPAERREKLDLGKSCVRFRSPEDLPLDLVREAVGRFPVDDFIALFESRR